MNQFRKGSSTVSGTAFLLLLSVCSLFFSCSSSSTISHAPDAPDAAVARDVPIQAEVTGEASAAKDSIELEPTDPTSVEPLAEDALLEDALGFDPAVRRGVLDNGLTYYVRQNQKPEKRAELRLVVNAGSLVEDEDQQGLAHFVEHMAFNGTEHFEKQELVDYLEKIGMRFGADINAYTSFDETVYMLEVPTDDEDILTTGFEILEDWAHGVSFDGDEIDKERGVVVEEWRLGRGARGRIQDQQLPVMFHGSRYAERMVIGEKEILENAPHEALRRFYQDWYRPDLMAVVAVGDFDPAAIEQRIHEQFSRIEPVEEPRERGEYPIPDHEETLISIVTDPEATSIDVAVGYKRPKLDNDTLADFRRSMVDNVYDGLLMARLRELTTKPNPPFQFAYAGSGGLGRSKSIYQLFTVVRDGGVARGLETLLTEARRVEEHGFTETELGRAKTQIERGMERAWDERDKRESGAFASEYVRHFLNGEPSPGLERELALVKQVLPEITLDEINQRADQWITDDNRVILVSGPDKPGAGIPEERALLAIFEEADQVAVLPWVDQTRDGPLVAEAPSPGRVVSEELFDEIGTTRWQLSNGVTVLLKPTDFKNDEIVLSGYSPGGHSLVSDQDYLSATQATTLVGEMGRGSFNQIELGKALTGKVAGARFFISERSEGLSGMASPKDLETLFELVYLGFTGARRDEEAFTAHIDTTRGWLENQEASPGFHFQVAFNQATYGDHPRRIILTSDKLDQIDLDRALAIYRDRFADASDFLFTLVGNFELEAMKPLVEQWLGGLPSIDRQESWRDVGAWASNQVEKFEVRRGIEPKSTVRLVFHGDAEWSYQGEHLAASLGSALRIRLREVLREDLGGVYGVGVYGRLLREPRQRYNVGVSFSCDPERVDELVEAVFAEMRAFREQGPDEEVLVKVREIQRRARETELQRNGFWAGQLLAHQRLGMDLGEILHYDRLVDAVTAEAVHEAAKNYFDESSYVLGILYPENASSGEAREVEAAPEDLGAAMPENLDVGKADQADEMVAAA